MGTVFPPALLWAAVMGNQTAAATALTLLASVALAVFGYLVWVAMFIRMGEIAVGPSSNSGHSCRNATHLGTSGKGRPISRESPLVAMVRIGAQ